MFITNKQTQTHHNIEDSCNLKEKLIYDIRLTINNPYDDKCHTPCNDGVYEHCDPKFSLDTHKDSSILIVEPPHSIADGDS